MNRVLRFGLETAEVKLFSGFTEQTISDAANELQSLFLLSTPPIARERRFAVASTTRQLIRSLGSELLPDFDGFVKDVHERKYRAVGEGRRTSLRTVSFAIHQAMAQMADGRAEDAIKTVDEVNKQLGGKNADLLSVRARSLATIEGKAPNVVRKAFELAYDAGQRKDVFFDCWYRAESKSLNWDGAIQVIDRALQGSVEKPGFWILKRLDARFEAASGHRTSDVEHAVNQIRAAMKDFESVARCADLSTSVDRLRIRRNLERFADLFWDLPRTSGNFVQWLDTLDCQLQLISLGDKRYEAYIRAAVAFVGMRTASSKDSPTGIVAEKLRHLLTTYSTAPAAVGRIPQFKSAYAELQGISGI